MDAEFNSVQFTTNTIFCQPFLNDLESLQLREVSRKSFFKCIGYAYDNNQGYAKSSA